MPQYIKKLSKLSEKLKVLYYKWHGMNRNKKKFTGGHTRVHYLVMMSMVTHSWVIQFFVSCWYFLSLISSIFLLLNAMHYEQPSRLTSLYQGPQSVTKSIKAFSFEPMAQYQLPSKVKVSSLKPEYKIFFCSFFASLLNLTLRQNHFGAVD